MSNDLRLHALLDNCRPEHKKEIIKNIKNYIDVMIQINCLQYFSNLHCPHCEFTTHILNCDKCVEWSNDLTNVLNMEHQLWMIENCIFA